MLGLYFRKHSILCQIAKLQLLPAIEETMWNSPKIEKLVACRRAWLGLPFAGDARLSHSAHFCKSVNRSFQEHIEHIEHMSLIRLLRPVVTRLYLMPLSPTQRKKPGRSGRSAPNHDRSLTILDKVPIGRCKLAAGLSKRQCQKTMSLNKLYKCHSTCHICHLIQAVNIIFAQNLYSGNQWEEFPEAPIDCMIQMWFRCWICWGFGFEWFEWFQWFEGLKSCWDGVHPSCARCFEANWVSCQRLTNWRVFHCFSCFSSQSLIHKLYLRETKLAVVYLSIWRHFGIFQCCHRVVTWFCTLFVIWYPSDVLHTQ